MSCTRSQGILLMVALIFWTSVAAPVRTRHRNISTSRQDQTAGSEQDRPPETCVVTRPPEKTFVPPAPYPSDSSKYSFWFGTNQLWTFLPVTGTWLHLGHYTPDDPTFRQKMFWFAQGYDWRKEPQPKLVITGRRVDGPSGPLLSDRANNGWTVDKNHAFMVVGINFPKLGCWEIKGRYRDAEVKFVVWVAP